MTLIFSLFASCSLLPSKKTSRNPQSVDSEDIVAFVMKKKDARKVIDYISERFALRPKESPTLQDWEEAILVKETPAVLVTREDFEVDMEKNLPSFEVASYNLGASKAFVIEDKEQTKEERTGQVVGLAGAGVVVVGAAREMVYTGVAIDMAYMRLASSKQGVKLPRLAKSGIPIMIGGFALAIGGLVAHIASKEARPWMIIVDQDASDYYKESAGRLLRNW